MALEAELEELKQQQQRDGLSSSVVGEVRAPPLLSLIRLITIWNSVYYYMMNTNCSNKVTLLSLRNRMWNCSLAWGLVWIHVSKWYGNVAAFVTTSLLEKQKEDFFLLKIHSSFQFMTLLEQSNPTFTLLQTVHDYMSCYSEKMQNGWQNLFISLVLFGIT